MNPRQQYKWDLQYDFLSLKKGDTLTDAFPELGQMPEVAKYGSGSNDKYLRYAMLLTDGGSGLLKINDLERRRAEALRIAGIDPEDSRAPACLDFSDEGVAEMAHALLRNTDSFILAYILAGEEMLWQDIRQMRTPIDRGRPDEEAPEGETEAEKKKRQNRAAWAATQETQEKIGRAYSLRGDFFDKIPGRIKSLAQERHDFFKSDSLLEKAVKDSVRRNDGEAEKLVKDGFYKQKTAE